MANLAGGHVVINPSFTEPGIILPYAQASGFQELMAGAEPQVKLEDGDLYVYMNSLDVRTRAAAGQAAYNSLPSISTTLKQISTPTYLMRVRGEFDHHDSAALARRNLNIMDVQRYGMRQAHFQLARNAFLYGMNPANGEGLINSAGATAVSLPPDTNGNQTATTYDNGQFAIFLLQQIAGIKTRTNQLGLGRKFTICGPQRVLGLFEYSGIVQLVQYQRPGGGTATVAGTVKDILASNGDEIAWVYDDTLIGKGAGGTDAIIINMPEVQKPQGNSFNTNEFARVANGIDACAVMYTDVAAPREIPTPLPGGATDILTEMRITSGWAVRPETVTVVSVPYP